MSDKDVDYQRQPQIDQAEQEIENAKALGMTDRVTAAEKTLECLREQAGRARREAAKDETDSDTEKLAVPHGRSSRQGKQQTTDKKD